MLSTTSDRPGSARPAGPWRPLRVIAVLGTGGLLSACLLAERATLHFDEPDTARWAHGLLTRLAIDWALFVAAVILLRAVPRRSAVTLIVLGAVALQLIAVVVPPTTSDDDYRYAWDGTVQAHGIDPYRYPPLAPELAGLRDPWLFPTDIERDPQATGNPDANDLCTTAGVPHPCTVINRPTVRTIYPPVAQAWFLLMHWFSPHRHRGVGLRVGEALLAVMTAVLLLAVLCRCGGNPRWAALWAWCPLVWSECGNNGHVEVLGVLLMLAALGVLELAPTRDDLSVRRAVAVGALFGAAVAAKLLPALAGPALLGRRARVVTTAAAGIFVLAYLPHVLAAGGKVLGYLPGYLHEEGYNGAQRFGALQALVPAEVAPWVGAALIATVAAWVWIGARRRSAAAGALLVTGTTLALVGPSQPWYGLMVAGLVALTGRWEWLPVAAAGYLVYLAGDIGVDATLMQQRTYLPALILALGITAVRARRCAPAHADADRPMDGVCRPT